ncbi:uncharacterized protein DMENIID0001_109530 [Sergentomyia squamirostris]
MGKRRIERSNCGERSRKVSKSEKSEDEEACFSTQNLVGTILEDINKKRWKVGKPLDKGSFGQIYLASEDLCKPITSENAKYVVKIEPHNNGPLFVEIHCLMNAGRCNEDQTLPPGMPKYIASGSHVFRKQRYRFLILERYIYNMHSILKEHHTLDQKNIVVIACQILDILQHLHDNGYAHSDIKAENLMIAKEEKIVEVESYSNRKVVYNENHPNGVFDEEWDPVKVGKKSERRITYDRLKKRLRPLKTINYCVDDSDSDSGSNCSEDFDEEIFVELPKIRRNTRRCDKKLKSVTIERIFLIDFGLASKFVDSAGVHRPFCIDQRRAHDGTLEFTSRDAHMGAHSRRSDLECLGYNLVYWSEGFLPWKLECDTTSNQQQILDRVHHMKEHFMMNVPTMLQHVYGKSVPKYLGTYLSYVANLTYCEKPDYSYCRRIFMDEYRRLGGIELVLNFSELQSSKVYEGGRVAKMIDAKIRDFKQRQEIGLKETPSVHLKNLRSKKVTNGEKSSDDKQYSWTDIVNIDPDFIVKDRTDREFTMNEEMATPSVYKYRGRPTYAIVEMEKKILEKSLCNDTLNGSTMLNVTQKSIKRTTDFTKSTFKKNTLPTTVKVQRRKSGLRTIIKPTRKSIFTSAKMSEQQKHVTKGKQVRKIIKLTEKLNGKKASVKRPATRSILKKMEDVINTKGPVTEKRPTYRG